MTTTAMPSSYAVHRASILTLGVGLIVSLLIHLGVGLSASGYFASMWDSKDALSNQIEVEPDAAQMPEPDKDLKLGMEEATKASIHWLGVVEDPEEGNAPIGEVDQAQFTPELGDAPETTSSEPAQEIDPVVQEPAQAVAQQPNAAQEVPVVAEEQPIASEERVQEPVQELVQESVQEPVLVPVDEPADARESQPSEALSEQVELKPERTQDAPVVIETQPEPVDEPSAAQEPEPDALPEPNEEKPIGPALVSVDPKKSEPEQETEDAQQADKPVEKPVEKPADELAKPVELVDPTKPDTPEAQARVEHQPPSVPAPSPSEAGKVGVVSNRESTVSIIKRALKADAKALNKPIAGPGIKILTVEPKFPASVRFTQLPKNPVLLIRFDATGRVKKVRFLRDKAHVYDTGARVVDEPLLSAVYKWRATGKAIDALDANDPRSTIEISMRILFRKDDDLP